MESSCTAPAGSGTGTALTFELRSEDAVRGMVMPEIGCCDVAERLIVSAAPDAPAPEAPAPNLPGGAPHCGICPGDSVRSRRCAAPTERRAPCVPLQTWVSGTCEAPLGTGSTIRAKGLGPLRADAICVNETFVIPAAIATAIHVRWHNLKPFTPSKTAAGH